MDDASSLLPFPLVSLGGSQGLKIFTKVDELGLSFSCTVEPLMLHFLLPILRHCSFKDVHDFIIGHFSSGFPSSLGGNCAS
eukprot:14751111-Ditylum_brightwellii.AAC.1